MAINILYPDPLDEAYQISFKPEANVNYPYVYRFFIRDGETGELVTPNDLTDYWAEYPDSGDASYTDEDRVLTAGLELAVRINISTLITRNGGKFGLYLISGHFYNTLEDVLAEREQSAYIYIIENGLKPPNLP